MATEEDVPARGRIPTFLYFVLDKFATGGCYHERKGALVVQEVQYTIHGVNLRLPWFDACPDFAESNPVIPSSPIPEPLLRLPSHTFPDQMGFALFDLKLYMVGGMCYPDEIDTKSTNNIIHRQTEPGQSRRVFILDTDLLSRTPNGSSGSSSVSLDDDYQKFVVEGPRLIHPKVDPVVIPVEGRLYVFPRWFNPRPAVADDSDHPAALVEVFDPSKESWSLVPSPPHPPTSLCKRLKIVDEEDDEENPYRIMAYTVIGSNKIFMSLKMCLSIDAGVYVFDTESRTWLVINNTSGITDNLPFFWNGFSWEDDQGKGQQLWINSRTEDGTLVVQDSVGHHKTIPIPRLFSPLSPSTQSHILKVDRDLGWVLALSWYLPGCDYCSVHRFMVVDIKLLHIIENRRKRKRVDDEKDEDESGGANEDRASGVEVVCEWMNNFVSKGPSTADHDIPVCFLI